MSTIDDLAFDVHGRFDLNETARQLVEALINSVTEVLADDFCEANGTNRNGYRERSLQTCVGTLTLRIPKVRSGSFFPEGIIERWSRVDVALVSTVCEMWVNGVSNRKVDKITSEMGIDHMDKSTVSRLCKKLDGEIERLRSRDLSENEWPYLWLDATYLNCREAGVCTSVATVVAVAADTQARRQVIGIECMDTESYVSWRDFLLSLRGRGFSGVKLAISDEHSGLVRAIREVFPGCSHQRCIAHLERNVSARARKKGNGAAAVAALKVVFGETDPHLVRAGYDKACRLYRAYDERGADLLEDAREEALAYLCFPANHRKWIRTNNVCERLNREIARRADVVQVFPMKTSLIRLIGAVCCDQNDEWLAERYFIDARTMPEIGDPDTTAEPDVEKKERFLKKVEEAFKEKMEEG